MSSIPFTPPRTLSDAVIPRGNTSRSWIIDSVQILLFSGFVALTARISIPLPFTAVPLTGQTLGVLFTGAVLGGRRATLALVLYLVEGVAGFPVFASSAVLVPGISRLVGPTGGYLFAFPLAAGLVGLLAERGWDRSRSRAVLATLIGNLVIYAVAIPWLSIFTHSLWTAFVKGMLPFVPGDLVKIAILAVALPGGWALVRHAEHANEGPAEQ